MDSEDSRDTPPDLPIEAPDQFCNGKDSLGRDRRHSRGNDYLGGYHAYEVFIMAKKSKPVEKAPEAEKAPIPVKPRNKGLIYLILCIVFLAASVGIFILYVITLQMFLGYLFVPPIGLAVFFYWRFKKKTEQVADLAYYGEKPLKLQVNSLNIYPPEKGGVLFEDTAKPEGQPWICDNDGKPYFIHCWNSKLSEFMLPDQVYCDPKYFGQRVLSLPAHRRLFVRKESLLKKASPFILLLVILAGWILILTTVPKQEEAKTASVIQAEVCFDTRP